MNILGQADAQISAAGTASVTVAPPANRQWRIMRVQIQAVRIGSDLQPTAQLYRNANTPANQIDSTAQGDRNESNKVFVVRAGESATVAWAGGTSGTQVSAIFYGDDATDSLELPLGVSGPGFELPLFAGDPQQAAGQTRTPTTASSTDLINIVAANLVPSGILYTSPTFDVREWRVINLFLAFQTSNADAEVNVIFTTTATGGASTGNYRLRTRNNKPIADSFVATGPFMRIEITVAGGANVITTLNVRGSNMPLYSGQGVPTAIGINNFGVGAILIQRPASALAPGVLVSQEAYYVQHGWATFHFYAETTGIQVGIEFLGADLAWHFFGEYFTNAGSVIWRDFRHIAIPPTLIRVYVFNQTAGALNAGYHITFGPST